MGQIVLESHSFLKYWQNCYIHVIVNTNIPTFFLLELNIHFMFSRPWNFQTLYILKVSLNLYDVIRSN